MKLIEVIGALAWIPTSGALATALQDEAAPAATWYVSPLGSDEWDGTAGAPAADGGKGPFATVERAQRAVREALAAGALDGPLVVSIRGGFHELERAIVFRPEDSGTESTPVIWRAHPGERPILSGGRRIEGWRVGEDGWWRAALPEVARGEWSFAQLFVNDQRRFRPRLPREGTFRIAAELPPSEAAAGSGHDRFGYRPGDVDPAWHRLEDVEVLGFHVWSASRMRIAEIDAEGRTLTFTGPTRTLQPWGAFREGHRFLAINVREALGEPGQWYLDRESGELTYVPRPGERPEEAEVVAPRLDTLLRLEGEPSEGRFVEHLRFQGLTFAHAGWTLPDEGQSFPQAEVNLGAAIEAVAAREVSIERCAVRHVGRYAIALGAGCRGVAVEGCELVDLGGGGIQIGLGGGSHSWPTRRPDPSHPESSVSHNRVRDCLIAGGGRLHPAAVGVWIGHASHTSVEHCEIRDLYYTGVSVGWVWGYAEPSRAHHNRIAWNRIRDIGQGVLSDMAGVYTLGVSPGTRVDHNLVHDVQAYDYGGWGLYTDEGSTGIEMTHNLVWGTKTGGFHQHYGRENLVAHNVFAEAAVQQLQRTRTEEHLSFRFERNIVYWTNESPLLGSNWRDDGFVLDRNLYWNPNRPDVRFPGGLSLEEWRRARGHDLESAIADPLFVDPGNDDWRLLPGSPALEMGFEPWDHARAGRTGECALTRGLPPPPAGY